MVVAGAGVHRRRRRAADCHGQRVSQTAAAHRRRTIYDARKARLKELMEGLLAEYPNVSTKEVAAFLLAIRKSIESCLRCCSKSGSTANASCSSAQIETLACIAMERRVPLVPDARLRQAHLSC